MLNVSSLFFPRGFSFMFHLLFRKLRQEMREAKNYRKMKKQNEKTLMKKRVSGELDVLSPDSTSTGPAKKVR